MHDHIAAVCRDIVTRYPVDGLHMDYIRFVSDSMTDPSAYPRDPESIELFTKSTARAWTGSPEDLAAYRDFKRDRITDLVRRIRTDSINKATRPAGAPPVAFTAAVWRRPELGRDTYLQDAAAWLNAGVIDRALPMIYTKDDKQLASDLSAWRAACPDKPISPGLGIYLHAPGSSGRQLDLAEAGGAPEVALFAYSALFESVDPNQDKSREKVDERAERLRLLEPELKAHIAALTAPPAAAAPANGNP